MLTRAPTLTVISESGDASASSAVGAAWAESLKRLSERELSQSRVQGASQTKPSTPRRALSRDRKRSAPDSIRTPSYSSLTDLAVRKENGSFSVRAVRSSWLSHTDPSSYSDVERYLDSNQQHPRRVLGSVHQSPRGQRHFTWDEESKSARASSDSSRSGSTPPSSSSSSASPKSPVHYSYASVGTTSQSEFFNQFVSIAPRKTLQALEVPSFTQPPPVSVTTRRQKLVTLKQETAATQTAQSNYHWAIRMKEADLIDRRDNPNKRGIDPFYVDQTTMMTKDVLETVQESVTAGFNIRDCEHILNPMTPSFEMSVSSSALELGQDFLKLVFESVRFLRKARARAHALEELTAEKKNQITEEKRAEARALYQAYRRVVTELNLQKTASAQFEAGEDLKYRMLIGSLKQAAEAGDQAAIQRCQAELAEENQKLNDRNIAAVQTIIELRRQKAELEGKIIDLCGELPEAARAEMAYKLAKSLKIPVDLLNPAQVQDPKPLSVVAVEEQTQAEAKDHKTGLIFSSANFGTRLLPTGLSNMDRLLVAQNASNAAFDTVGSVCSFVAVPLTVAFVIKNGADLYRADQKAKTADKILKREALEVHPNPIIDQATLAVKAKQRLGVLKMLFIKSCIGVAATIFPCLEIIGTVVVKLSFLAALATPVGWILGAVGLALGLGMTIYYIYSYRQTRARVQLLGEQMTGNVPVDSVFSRRWDRFVQGIQRQEYFQFGDKKEIARLEQLQQQKASLEAEIETLKRMEESDLNAERHLLQERERDLESLKKDILTQWSIVLTSIQMELVERGETTDHSIRKTEAVIALKTVRHRELLNHYKEQEALLRAYKRGDHTEKIQQLKNTISDLRSQIRTLRAGLLFELSTMRFEYAQEQLAQLEEQLQSAKLEIKKLQGKLVKESHNQVLQSLAEINQLRNDPDYQKQKLNQEYILCLYDYLATRQHLKTVEEIGVFDPQNEILKQFKRELVDTKNLEHIGNQMIIEEPKFACDIFISQLGIEGSVFGRTACVLSKFGIDRGTLKILIEVQQKLWEAQSALALEIEKQEAFTRSRLPLSADAEAKIKSLEVQTAAALKQLEAARDHLAELLSMK